MSIKLNTVSNTIKSIVNRLAGQTPEKLREQNPYSYEDNSPYNNIQNKILNNPMEKPQNPYENLSDYVKPAIAQQKRIPIPPKEQEIIKQIQPQIQQRKNEINLVEAPQVQGTTAPQPTKAPGVPVYYNAKKYDIDNGGDGNIAQPTAQVHELASKYFKGDDVEKAIIASLFESNYDPNRTNRNPETGEVPSGGEDRGLMQINENSFRDYMRRMPKVLAQYGITSYDDMWDAEKNMAMASIIHKYQGFGAWYGPAANGYNIYDSQEVYQRNRGAIDTWKADNNSPNV